MKICLINNLYKPFNRGGAEAIVEIMANQFRYDGHDIFVISTSPKKDYKINKIDDIRYYYLKSLYYNLNKIPIILRLFWHGWDMFDFITYYKVKHILNKENPDLVITNNLKGISYLLPKAISKLRIRHIHILHDIQLIYPSGALTYGQEYKLKHPIVKLYRVLCSLLFASTNIVISPSNWFMSMKKEIFF
jgi:glycosyltransferase involved in cell wall biosynthesis